MNIDIKMVWNVFKHEKIEKEYLFYRNDSEWNAIKISKNETEQYGSLDLDYLSSISDSLSGKQVFVVHNHVKDDPKPSFPDFYQYEYLHSLFSLMGIELIDFLIVSVYGYFSFAENNLMISLPLFNPSEGYSKLDTFPIQNCEFILHYKEDILNRLQINKELIFSTSLHVGTKNHFSGKDLLYFSRLLEKKCVFITQFNGEQMEMERMNCILEVLKPIEYYMIQNGKCIPMKKNGFKLTVS